MEHEGTHALKAQGRVKIDCARVRGADVVRTVKRMPHGIREQRLRKLGHGEGDCSYAKRDAASRDETRPQRVLRAEQPGVLRLMHRARQSLRHGADPKILVGDALRGFDDARDCRAETMQ